MLDVLLGNRKVCKFGKSIMAELSMKLVFFNFTFIFRKFSAKLSTIVNWCFFVGCAEIMPRFCIFIVYNNSLMTVLNYLLVLLGNDALIILRILFYSVLLARLQNFKLSAA